MKPTILTPAILMAATLFAATAAHAQSASAKSAWPPGPTGDAKSAWPPGPTGDATAYPPGPSAQAYPPGPSGQAAAQTQNVNVVNAPTVQVGNEVAVKEPVRTPLYVQKSWNITPGSMNVSSAKVDAPAGTRMVIETISLVCYSSTPQPVGASVFKAGLSYAAVSLFPQPVAWATSSFSSEVAQVHLLVDDSISLSVERATQNGFSNCAVTVSGYTTPLP